MPPAPPLPIRVCPKHGLVAGPDGRCMICHRDDANTDDDTGARRLVFGLVAALAIVGGVVASKVRTKPPPVVGASERPALVAPRPAEAPEDPEPARSPEAAMAEAHAAQEQQRQRSIEDEMRKVPIRMYMARTCDICDGARDWFKEKGMTCSEVDVNANPSALEELKKLTPNPVLPTFDVDGEVLVSFAPTLMLGAVRRAAERRTR